MDNNIGKKIDGRYEITELIGIGGMADVYKAVDLMENKIVAVKILKTVFANNEDFQRRFRNESKAIAVLSHPNIVKIFDVGFTDKIQYIVMEYIDGVTLKEFMEQQGTLKPKDAVYFATQILRALQHAHDRGIVHRDIKPQNIMLFSDGSIKVMDFGIARFSRQEGKTLSDKTIGSVHYISPEQARGDLTDEKSDIYSVGAMLFEMLTGEKPFEADTPVAVALMHMQEVLRKPSSINSEIPKGIEEIILRAMQKEPTRRYQSASEMIKDFDTFKVNPAVVFGYGATATAMPDTEGSTIFFNPISKTDTSEINNIDDEIDDEEKSSWLIPVLTGVTVSVVVIAAIIICVLLIKSLKTGESETIKIPNFVGSSYAEIKGKFGENLQFDISEEYSSEFEKGFVISQDISEGRLVSIGHKIKLTISKGIESATVPDVKGKSYDVAKLILEEAGFFPTKVQKSDENVPSGSVISTDPVEFTKLQLGSTVTVYVSIGPTSNAVNVPNVVGMTQDKAQSTLRNSKLNPTFVAVQSTLPKGEVVSQSLEANSIAKIGDDVVCQVSSGEISETTVDITLPIKPGKAKGPFRITAYIDGSPIATKDISKIELADGDTLISVNGLGDKITVKFEVVSLQGTNPTSYLYASAEVDFVAKEVLDIKVIDPSAFEKSFKSAEETTTTTTTTTTPPEETTTTTTTTTTTPEDTTTTTTTTDVAPPAPQTGDEI